MAHLSDHLFQSICKYIEASKPRKFIVEDNGTIYFRSRLGMPLNATMKMVIMREAHRTRYMVQQGETNV